jgi:hypothetical protein
MAQNIRKYGSCHLINMKVTIMETPWNFQDTGTYINHNTNAGSKAIAIIPGLLELSRDSQILYAIRKLGCPWSLG